jgi:hypothetical protein
MADEQNEGAQEDQASEVIAHLDDKDWFLQQVIATANLGLSMGLTITLGGTVISGQLISGRQYFEELSDQIKGGSTNMGNETLEMLGDNWKMLTQIYDKPEGAGDDWQPAPAGYIHMRQAKIYTPGQHPLPGGQGLLWRGKVAAVDGFALGQFGDAS